MARTVENSVGHALDALMCPNLERAAALSSQCSWSSPRVNEMEMPDRRPRGCGCCARDCSMMKKSGALWRRRKLQRPGAHRRSRGQYLRTRISLAGMNVKRRRRNWKPMSGAVRGMLGRSLGALIFRNIVLAGEVLEVGRRGGPLPGTRFLSTCSRG